jgi:hypothetical protein
MMSCRMPVEGGPALRVIHLSGQDRPVPSGSAGGLDPVVESVLASEWVVAGLAQSCL